MLLSYVHSQRTLLRFGRSFLENHGETTTMIPYNLSPAWFNLYKYERWEGSWLDWPCRVTSQTPLPIQSQTCDKGMTWGYLSIRGHTRVRTCVPYVSSKSGVREDGQEIKKIHFDYLFIYLLPNF